MKDAVILNCLKRQTYCQKERNKSYLFTAR